MSDKRFLPGYQQNMQGEWVYHSRHLPLGFTWDVVEAGVQALCDTEDWTNQQHRACEIFTRMAKAEAGIK